MIENFLSTDGLLVGTLLPFLFVIVVVVFIHELGHYLVGRWCGIGATAFSVGFGPEIAGFTDKRGTRWKLSAVPLGGYVKFTGDMTVTSSRPADESDLSEEDRARAFHRAALWKRFLTVIAGPLANFILAIAVFSVFLSVYGRVEIEPVINEVVADTPAQAAGLQSGDRILSVDGSPIGSFTDIQRIVALRTGDSLAFLVERNGSEETVAVTPEYVERTLPDGTVERRGLVGITSMGGDSDYVRHVTMSVPSAIGMAFAETGSLIEATGRFLVRFAQGREDRCQLGGPVKIAEMSGQAASQGFPRLIELMALLSVGIGFLNLLPIPPLDGGHIAFYAAEAVMRRPLSERVVEFGYRLGFVAVLAFMGFVLFNDIFGC